jgi:hypothetical protein
MSDPTSRELQEWADVCAQAALLALAGVEVYAKYFPTQQSFSWTTYVDAIRPYVWGMIQRYAQPPTLRQAGFNMKHNLSHNDPHSTAQYLYYLSDQLLKEIADDN